MWLRHLIFMENCADSTQMFEFTIWEPSWNYVTTFLVIWKILHNLTLWQKCLLPLVNFLIQPSTLYLLFCDVISTHREFFHRILLNSSQFFQFKKNADFNSKSLSNFLFKIELLGTIIKLRYYGRWGKVSKVVWHNFFYCQKGRNIRIISSSKLFLNFCFLWSQ